LIHRGDKFCAYCGASAGEALATLARPQVQDTHTGERRHVTVLFSDIVNSTGIASQLDPEDWQELSAEYLRAGADAVSRFGGYVAQFLGDGMLVYFGFPEAQENAPERAVRAGLTILEAVDALNRRSKDERKRLAFRVGIHTGEVVIGHDGSGNPELFGKTTNVAARVQADAEPGTLFITAPVHRLVSGLFVVEQRGARQLKGVPEPIELFRVRQASGVRDRFHAAAASTGLIPFVGREEELELLWRRWERARDGEGQVVVIIGEPGIGKSRLIEEMHARLAQVPHTWIECGCHQLLQNTPLHPVIEMLRQGFPYLPDDSTEVRIKALESALELVGMRPANTLPLIAPLLDLQVPATYPLRLTTPDQQHKRLIATLAQWLFGLAREQAVVIAIEDLQWADPSSIELAHLLSEQNATAPVLILCTTRSEFRVPWQLHAHHAYLTLSPLTRRETRAMVEEVAVRGHLSSETIDAVVDRTGGIPLFIEELTRLMIDSQGRAEREIPPTLHDSLAARLGRVGSAREIAQIGAVVGREFNYELMRAVSGLPESELQTQLTRLTDADILYVRGVPPEALYRFKHALLREAAYEALLKTRRRELHARVAQLLSQQFKDVAQSQPEVLARHLTEANQHEEAVEAWQRAGKMATKRGAFAEAEGHFRRALEVFMKLPESGTRGPQELTLKGDLAVTLMATKGWAAPEAKEIFEDTLVVTRRFGDPTASALLLASLFASVFIAGEMEAARAIASEMAGVSERTGSEFAQTWADSILSMVELVTGDIAAARSRAQRAIAAYDEDAHRISPMDPIVIARAQESAAAVISGEIGPGRLKARVMLELAGRGNRIIDLAQARMEAFAIYFHLRDPAEVGVHAKALIADANKHNLRAYLAWGMIYLGWSVAMMGDAAEGLATLRAGLDLYAASGSRLQINRYLCMLADAQAAAGMLDDALVSVDEALRAAPEQPIDEPSILWKRGELLMAKRNGLADDDNQKLLEMAEQDFKDAIARAHAIGAKLFELRPATSLARIMKERGETERARHLLRPICDSFAGVDGSSDVKDAVRLLEELAG
jgi:class 3 adenylate cyclase/tetratricopeptide (TPR) repeat protein